MTTDARTLEGLLRNDFRAFIHKVFTTLCPGQHYERSWHIEAIAYQLERVRRGEIMLPKSKSNNSCAMLAALAPDRGADSALWLTIPLAVRSAPLSCSNSPIGGSGVKTGLIEFLCRRLCQLVGKDQFDVAPSVRPAPENT